MPYYKARIDCCKTEQHALSLSIVHVKPSRDFNGIVKSKPLILCLCFWVSDHPELYKDKEGQGASRGAVEPPAEGGRDVGNRRQAATDEIMLERFRKRERSRLMRR